MSPSAADNRKVSRLALLLMAIVFSGCASTVHLESERKLHRFDSGIQSVFVTNPDSQSEYRILAASGIYRLVDESDGAPKLTLHPIRHHFRCGNPLLLSGITLGIRPGYLPAPKTFEYDLEIDGVAKRYTHHLRMYERFSIWEWLVRQVEDQVLAEALAWSGNASQPSP